MKINKFGFLEARSISSNLEEEVYYYIRIDAIITLKDYSESVLYLSTIDSKVYFLEGSVDEYFTLLEKHNKRKG